MTNEKYKEINKNLWNKKTPIHLESDFYEMEDFRAGKNTLKPIEMNLLGDVSGKSILHLQCHFGQDSLSLSRMGAKVTGVDISDVSIAEAKKLNEELKLDADFVCCDVYSAPEHISEQFDIIFCTYGTIGWLPDMAKWAAVVQHFLKPKGKFIFVELHPVVWMYDDTFSHIAWPYFNREAIVEETPGTYADQNADIQLTEIGWNHSIGEVVGNLLSTGLRLTHLEEYDYTPHNCFKGLKERAPGEYIVEKLGDKIPMTYSLVMSN